MLLSIMVENVLKYSPLSIILVHQIIHSPTIDASKHVEEC